MSKAWFWGLGAPRPCDRLAEYFPRPSLARHCGRQWAHKVPQWHGPHGQPVRAQRSQALCLHVLGAPVQHSPAAVRAAGPSVQQTAPALLYQPSLPPPPTSASSHLRLPLLCNPFIVMSALLRPLACYVMTTRQFLLRTRCSCLTPSSPV